MNPIDMAKHYDVAVIGAGSAGIGAASLILGDGCAMPEFNPIAGRPLTAKVQLHPETMKLMYRQKRFNF